MSARQNIESQQLVATQWFAAADDWSEDTQPSLASGEIEPDADFMAMRNRDTDAPLEPRPRRWPVVVAVAASAALVPAMLMLAFGRHSHADALPAPRVVNDPSAVTGEPDAARHWEMFRNVSTESGEESH